MSRVLILYSDPVFRKRLWLALVKLGYEVFEAANISEAAKIHRYLPSDLLITDLDGRRAKDVGEIEAFYRKYPILRVFSLAQGYGVVVEDSTLLIRELERCVGRTCG